MGLEIEYLPGQTPIDEEEMDGLLIKTIATRGELDEFEQLNIQNAIRWTIGKKFKREEILTDDFVNLLHKKCLIRFGPGLENTEGVIKTLEWIST